MIDFFPLIVVVVVLIVPSIFYLSIGQIHVFFFLLHLFPIGFFSIFLIEFIRNIITPGDLSSYFHFLTIFIIMIFV